MLLPDWLLHLLCRIPVPSGIFIIVISHVRQPSYIAIPSVHWSSLVSSKNRMKFTFFCIQILQLKWTYIVHKNSNLKETYVWGLSLRRAGWESSVVGGISSDCGWDAAPPPNKKTLIMFHRNKNGAKSQVRTPPPAPPGVDITEDIRCEKKQA